jgi:hypothetical protein
MRDLVQAWAALVVLSLGTVVLSSIGTAGQRGAFVAAGVLVLAWLKARVILGRYLGLAGSRFWTRTFGLVIGMFLVLSFALYLFGSRA